MAIMERLGWQRKASEAGVAKSTLPLLSARPERVKAQTARPEKSRSQCPYALKGQKLLAQGIALGTMAARLSP